MTLFLSYETGQYNFNNLTTPEIVTEFFQKEFPDALDLMPDLVMSFLKTQQPLRNCKMFSLAL